MDKAFSEEGRESHRMAFWGLEVVAGFCVACLFTLALMTSPFNFREKLATCMFSAALPTLVWARVSLDGEGSEHVWKITSNLRLLGYTLAIAGFGILLSAVYWLASVIYGMAAIWSALAFARAKRRADALAHVSTQQPGSVREKTGDTNTPPHSAGDDMS